MTNKYIRDRARRRYNSNNIRMGEMRHYREYDERNPYGSRGGYVSSRKMRDRSMDMEEYYPEHNSRLYRRNDAEYNYGDYNYNGERYGKYPNYYEYEMYPKYDYASEDLEKRWEEDLYSWKERLKSRDKFRLSKEQIIQSAKQMNIMFTDYSEEEFLTTYYMMMSDYPNVATNYQTYIEMAKNFLNDDDSELKGSDKLCAYYYEVVRAGKD